MYNLNSVRLALLLEEPTFANFQESSFEKAAENDYQEWLENGNFGTYFCIENTGDVDFKYRSAVHNECRTFLYSDYKNSNAPNFYEVVNCLVLRDTYTLETLSNELQNLCNELQLGDDNGGDPFGHIWVVELESLSTEQIELFEKEGFELECMFKVQKDLKEFGEILDFYGKFQFQLVRLKVTVSLPNIDIVTGFNSNWYD